MVDHQLRETWPVNEHYALDRFCELNGLRSKARCSYKDALICAVSCKGAVETLNLRTSHHALPSLRLDIHLFKTKLVEGNNAVYPAVASAADALKISSTGSIAHPVKKIEDYHFKVPGRDGRDRF